MAGLSHATKTSVSYRADYSYKSGSKELELSFVHAQAKLDVYQI